MEYKLPPVTPAVARRDSASTVNCLQLNVGRVIAKAANADLVVCVWKRTFHQ